MAHLVRTTGASPEAAERLVEDVLSYFTETVDEYVRRRHRELQRREATNPVIWSQIVREIPTRRFAAVPLTERQLRRIVYG